jgi:AcrR family transcriptional regulator
MRKVDPERVAQQRSEIVEAAMRCFAKRGVQTATTDDICREAGISPGRLYYYFSSKEQVVEAVALDLNEHMYLDLDQELAEGDLFAAVMRHESALRGEMERRGVSVALTLELFSQAGRSPRVQAAVQEGASRRLQVLRTELERRKLQGGLREDTDIDALTAAMAALFSGIEMLALTDPDYDLDRYQRGAEMLLRPWIAQA